MKFLPYIQHYLRLIKFTHTIFAMPFALIGFSLGIQDQLGSTNPSLLGWGWTLFWVILCMVFARSAAMGFNRYLDRNIDALNPRTASREIPAGVIGAGPFFGLCCVWYLPEVPRWVSIGIWIGILMR